MTINELRCAGKISNRLWNTILRNAANDFDRLFDYRGWICLYAKGIKTNDIINLTVKDLFDMLGEERISRWRNLGPKGLEELKGLI